MVAHCENTVVGAAGPTRLFYARLARTGYSLSSRARSLSGDWLQSLHALARAFRSHHAGSEGLAYRRFRPQARGSF